LVGSEDDLILDAYRLARYYHQPPDYFLDMPLSVMRNHLKRTAELTRIMRAAASADEE